MTSQSMWAYLLDAPGRFREIEMPAPAEAELAAGEVLLRVHVGGICGSDLPFFKGRVPPYGTRSASGRVVLPPGAPLHEVVGEVVSSRDPSLAPGVLVVGWATKHNAISEYIVTSGSGLHAFGPDLTPSAAIMLQPLACVIHAVDRLANVQGSTAAVVGQGPIGMLFSHVLKRRGAARVIGVDRVDRSDLAATFQVDEPVWAGSDSWAALAAAGADQPDIIVEAVGHQVSTLTDATTALRHGGQIYYFGIPDDPVYPFPMAAFLRKNATLISGVTSFPARRAVLKRAEDYIRDSPEIAAAYITDKFNVTDVTAAFNVASTPGAGRLKVILEA